MLDFMIECLEIGAGSGWEDAIQEVEGIKSGSRNVDSTLSKQVLEDKIYGPNSRLIDLLCEWVELDREAMKCADVIKTLREKTSNRIPEYAEFTPFQSCHAGILANRNAFLNQDGEDKKHWIFIPMRAR